MRVLPNDYRSAGLRSAGLRKLALCAIATALLAPATLHAEPATSGAAPTAAPYDAARIYWNTTTLLPLSGSVDPLDPNSSALRARFYEFLTLGTRDAGVPGLSAAVSGWFVGEITEPFAALEPDRFRGDLLYGHVAWRGFDDNFEVKLGRQFVWLGAANGLILDGLRVAGDLPWDLEVSAYGGLIAPIRFRYDEADRFKNFAAGARFAWAPWDWGHVALSYAYEGQGSSVSREQLGVDASLSHFDWMELRGDVLVDLVNSDLDEGRASVDLIPLHGLRIGLEYEGVDTTSRLSKTSIFQVFSDDVYHAVGGDVDWQSEGMLGLEAGYRRYIYSDGATGYKASFGARILLDRKTRDVVGVEYGRLDADFNAYHQARVYGRFTVIEDIYVAGDVNSFFYDEELKGFDRTHFATVMAGWEILPGMKIEGDLGVTIDPRYQYALHGMLRFVYEGATAVGG